MAGLAATTALLPTLAAADAFTTEAARMQVRAALDTWTTKLAQRNPANIVSLYAPNAVLLATFAKAPIGAPSPRTKYFEGLMKNEGLRCRIDSVTTRIYGDIGINSGLYTFMYEKDGKTVNVPARYTFVYQRNGSGWRILEHHSSLQPN